MASIRPNPIKEITQLRLQVVSLSRELEITTQRCPLLGRLVTGNSAVVSAEDLLLTDVEVQEAALRALWLGHYWGLACDLGILPELSKVQADRWQSVSPAVEVLHAAAADVARHVRERFQGLAPPCQPSETSIATTNDQREVGTLTVAVRACVADVVDIERALRRAEALGVVLSCRTSLVRLSQSFVVASSSSSDHALKLLDDFDDPAQPAFGPSLLPTVAVNEVEFCVSWLTIFWGRAALADIQPQVSQDQAEFWAEKLGLPATLLDFADIEQSFQELEVYGIEEIFWKQR